MMARIQSHVKTMTMAHFWVIFFRVVVHYVLWRYVPCIRRYYRTWCTNTTDHHHPSTTTILRTYILVTGHPGMFCLFNFLLPYLSRDFISIGFTLVYIKIINTKSPPYIFVSIKYVSKFFIVFYSMVLVIVTVHMSYIPFLSSPFWGRTWWSVELIETKIE